MTVRQSRVSQIGFASVPIDARIDGCPRIESFSGEFFRDPVDIHLETINGLSLAA